MKYIRTMNFKFFENKSKDGSLSNFEEYAGIK